MARWRRLAPASAGRAGPRRRGGQVARSTQSATPEPCAHRRRRPGPPRRRGRCPAPTALTPEQLPNVRMCSCACVKHVYDALTTKSSRAWAAEAATRCSRRLPSAILASRQMLRKHSRSIPRTMCVTRPVMNLGLAPCQTWSTVAQSADEILRGVISGRLFGGSCGGER